MIGFVAFLSDKYKEIEENNSMGETRELFKKTRNTNRTFAKMGTIKDRDGMDLTEAEEEVHTRIHRRTILKRSAVPKDVQTTAQLHSSHTLIK